MAVLHYSKNICGTKAKNINSTDDKDKVTCKRCLKKMSSSNLGKIKVEKIKDQVTLSFKRVQFGLKMGINTMLLFSAPDGNIFTSTALCGTNIKRNMDEKDRVYFKELFNSLKDGGKLTGEKVYNHFNGV